MSDGGGRRDYERVLAAVESLDFAGDAARDGALLLAITSGSRLVATDRYVPFKNGSFWSESGVDMR